MFVEIGSLLSSETRAWSSIKLDANKRRAITINCAPSGPASGIGIGLLLLLLTVSSSTQQATNDIDRQQWLGSARLHDGQQTATSYAIEQPTNNKALEPPPLNNYAVQQNRASKQQQMAAIHQAPLMQYRSYSDAYFAATGDRDSVAAGERSPLSQSNVVVERSSNHGDDRAGDLNRRLMPTVELIADDNRRANIRAARQLPLLLRNKPVSLQVARLKPLLQDERLLSDKRQYLLVNRGQIANKPLVTNRVIGNRRADATPAPSVTQSPSQDARSPIASALGALLRRRRPTSVSATSSAPSATSGPTSGTSASANRAVSLAGRALAKRLRELTTGVDLGRLARKADWKGLSVKLLKVFMQYFLDLMLSDMFGTTGATKRSSEPVTKQADMNPVLRRAILSQLLQLAIMEASKQIREH